VTGPELLRQIMESRLLDVHTALPCEVVFFDATAQTITAQPLIKNIIPYPDGTEVEESYPQIQNVPVVYPRSGATVIAFPLAAGDKVTVIFCERSIDRYLDQGLEVHPVDLERHSFAGAVAFPGGPYPAAEPIAETIDGLILGYDGGAVIKIKDDGTLRLGATAGTMQPAALGDDTKAQLDALAQAINDLKTVFSVWVVSPLDGGGALKTASEAWAAAPVTVTEVGSSKVEIEE